MSNTAPSAATADSAAPVPAATAAGPSREEQVYRSRTAASAAFAAEAREYLPGADSRSPLFYAPYPAVLDRGERCWLYDLDGNRLLDFTGNHSSLVLGYGNPAVDAEVRRQLDKGTAFPGATEPQMRLARHLCRRVPSLERVRFTNSGTEASMMALRGARGFTGRPLVAKIEGGYSGSLDGQMVSTHPPADRAGDAARPNAVPASLGLAPGSTEGVLIIPFNDIEASVRLIEQARDRLAAVIVEPVMGSAGMIAADREYLHALREVTRRHGILLILDEVVSFRVAYGGAAEHYGVTPDLYVYGKLIGGGFPLGAFGGRADVMALFDPSRGRPQIPHPGSYNANPVSLIAGAACLEQLTADVIARLNRLGDRVRGQARSAFAEAGVTAQVTGLGSLFAFHLTDRPVRNFRDTWSVDAGLRHRIFLGLFNEGVLIDPRSVGCVSAAVGEPEVDQFIVALKSVLRKL